MNIKKLVQNIQYPNRETEKNFEWSSADGFAFLGCAKAKLLLDWKKEYIEVVQRKFRLNGENEILSTKTVLSKGADYVYTLWTCSEFFDEIGEGDKLNEMERIASEIGCYKNTWHRYSNEECFLIVPNVTSAAALIKARVRENKEAIDLIEVLRKNQCSNGNWNYFSLSKKLEVAKKVNEEDCFHMAMIIYHLMKIEELSGIYTKDICEKAMSWLLDDSVRCKICSKMKEKLCPGTIGWGFPMQLMVIGYDEEKYEKLFSKTVECLNHPNFRVRSLAALALAECEK